MYVSKRNPDNPILLPNHDHYWESFATFNLSPIKKGRTIYGLYRAISAVDNLRIPKQVSVIGIAKSKDGVHFKDSVPFITPKEEWEQYGCEDPRITFFEGKYYIFYTAISKYPFGAEGIKVAVAVSKDLEKINERHFVTPFNAKAMALFPERINGKIVVIFSINTDSPPSHTVFAYLDKIEDLWSAKFWEKWEKEKETHIVDLKRNPYDHVEIGATPIKTKYGWLLVYSHIQNYFGNPEHLPTVFGIEALILDLKDPKKIIARTKGPMLVPEELYELSGYIENVVFPSGALLEKDTLTVYYGAADTTVCSFSVNFTDLVGTMHPDTEDEFSFKRFSKNPVLLPSLNNEWEKQAVFNPAVINLEGKTHILYRAMSGDNTSTVGYASTINGFDINERLEQPIYVPREEFETKKIPGGNSGCEDPRITKIGTNLYMCYTAYDGIGPPRVAVSSISEIDFLKQNWNWSKPVLLTPRDIDDKDTCIISEKFKEGYCVLHRVSSEICADFVASLDFQHDTVKKCIRIAGPRRNMWDSSKVGIAAPPIKTKYGWLLLYHGVSKSHSTYRLGFILLDLKDPAIVLARSTDPVFEPREDYEKYGVVNNVVFPCGMSLKDKTLFIYYGGADKVIGVATMELDIVLKALNRKFT